MKLADQIAGMMTREIKEQQENEKGHTSIATIETDLRDLLRKIGIEALGSI